VPVEQEVGRICRLAKRRPFQVDPLPIERLRCNHIQLHFCGKALSRVLRAPKRNLKFHIASWSEISCLTKRSKGEEKKRLFARKYDATFRGHFRHVTRREGKRTRKRTHVIPNEHLPRIAQPQRDTNAWHGRVGARIRY